MRAIIVCGTAQTFSPQRDKLVQNVQQRKKAKIQLPYLPETEVFKLCIQRLYVSV